MSELWSQILENLEFVAASIAIVVAIFLLAKLSERFLPEKHRITEARRVSIIGICGAVAGILYLFDFPLVIFAPEFYKLDFSEVPVMLCGFYLGPSGAIACQGIKALVKLLLKGTTTAFVGDLANFVVGCSLVLPAVLIYHIRKSKNSAIFGLAVGTLILTVFGSAFNAIYLLPKFAQLYGIPLEAIISMGNAIHADVNSVSTFVLFCVAPINVIKGTMVSTLTMLLYKKVARPLFGVHK